MANRRDYNQKMAASRPRKRDSKRVMQQRPLPKPDSRMTPLTTPKPTSSFNKMDRLKQDARYLKELRRTRNDMQTPPTPTPPKPPTRTPLEGSYDRNKHQGSFKFKVRKGAHAKNYKVGK